MVKLNFPLVSVLVWPTSSIPEASLIRITSSPGEGLLVVPLVMVPLRVAANEDDAIRTNRIVAIGIIFSRSRNWQILGRAGLPGLRKAVASPDSAALKAPLHPKSSIRFFAKWFEIVKLFVPSCFEPIRPPPPPIHTFQSPPDPHPS